MICSFIQRIAPATTTCFASVDDIKKAVRLVAAPHFANDNNEPIQVFPVRGGKFNGQFEPDVFIILRVKNISFYCVNNNGKSAMYVY